MPLITCITDVTSHPEWINRNTDYYLVPSGEVRQSHVLPYSLCISHDLHILPPPVQTFKQLLVMPCDNRCVDVRNFAG